MMTYHNFTFQVVLLLSTVSYSNRMGVQAFVHGTNLSLTNFGPSSFNLASTSEPSSIRYDYLRAQSKVRGDKHLPTISISISSSTSVHFSRQDENNDTKSESEPNGTSLSINDIQAKIQSLPSAEEAITKLNDAISNIYKNPEEFGSRGEFYVILQWSVILFTLIGFVPFIPWVNDVLLLLFGPGSFLLGVVLMALGILEMGDNFTAYSVPVQASDDDEVAVNGNTANEGLVQSGVFTIIRHPVYSGNIFLLIGFSVMTGSIERLILTALYYGVVEWKSSKEEEELIKTYGEKYINYKENVPSKFVPQTFNWMKL